MRRNRLDRLWREADAAGTRWDLPRFKRILEILVDYDDEHWTRARDRLAIRELQGPGPEPTIISMSPAALDRLAVTSEADDPLTRLSENEVDEEQALSPDDVALYLQDVAPGEAAADALQEKLSRRKRGKAGWKKQR